MIIGPLLAWFDYTTLPSLTSRFNEFIFSDNFCNRISDYAYLIYDKVVCYYSLYNNKMISVIHLCRLMLISLITRVFNV